MACFHPLQGWRANRPNENGKFPIVFTLSRGFADQPRSIPCGQCTGCRLERSRQWAIRCVHEASLYEDNAFVTLTYDNEHLPADRSLHHRHFQLFMKRLRKRFGAGIRYYMCGEYGETYFRPHYHALLFNLAFDDRRLFKRERETNLYTSEALSELWGHGYATLGDVTFESAAYCARYVMKKISGDPAEAHYQYIDPDTGEVFDRRPEYCQPSTNGGIGKGWFEKYGRETYRDDFIVLRGKKMRPPKFYDKLVEATDLLDMEPIKRARRKAGRKRQSDNTPERRRVKEKVTEARLKTLKRTIE